MSRANSLTERQNFECDERAETRRRTTSLTLPVPVPTRTPHTRTRTPLTDLTATRDPTPLSPVTSASDTLSSPSSIDFTPIPTPPPQYTPQQTTIIRTPIPPTPLPLFTTLVTDDDMPPIEMFRGSASGKEHAQNWLRKLKANKFTTTTSDADRIFILENHLEVGSRADQWFQAIPIADRVKWTVVEVKFTARWPAAKKPTPTRDELHVRFTNITLGDHDLGKKVGDGEEEDQEWSHIDWAIRVRAAADDIGDPNGNRRQTYPALFEACSLPALTRTGTPLSKPSASSKFPNSLMLSKTDGTYKTSNPSIRPTHHLHLHLHHQLHQRPIAHLIAPPTNALFLPHHPHHPIPNTTHAIRSATHHSHEPESCIAVRFCFEQRQHSRSHSSARHSSQPQLKQ